MDIASAPCHRRGDLDITRVPVRVVTLPASWRDTEAVYRCRHRRHLLLRSAHHMGLLDLATSRVAALPPHPHRRLSSAAVLCPPSRGLAVAAGDTDSVLTVTRMPSSSPSWPLSPPSPPLPPTCATLVLGQSDVWATVTAGLRVDTIVPCDAAAALAVCHRQKEGAVAWMCSLTTEQAWPVPLPGPAAESTASSPVRLYDLAHRQDSDDAALLSLASPATEVVLGSAGGTSVSVHLASTLAVTATFPFLNLGGTTAAAASRHWSVEDFAATGPEHLYTVVLRDGERRPWIACFDTRKPIEPYLCTRVGEAEEAGGEPWSLLESFGVRDGAAGLLTAAAGARLRLTTWRTTPNGFCPAHCLAVLPRGGAEEAAATRVCAMACDSDGVLHLVRTPA